MKKRILLLLVSLGIVASGAAVVNSEAHPQAGPACYYVISFWPYPHQVLYCPPNGGGSW